MPAPKRILFIHQNFPGQFRHLAPALAQRGHQVLALGILGEPAVRTWQQVRVVSYKPHRGNTQGLHPWLLDMETKLIRGEACWRTLQALRSQGFQPDLVIAHPGWGESLFVKQVWPNCKLALYGEFFYQAQGADTGFDPEFPPRDAASDLCRLQMKNLNHLAHLDQADAVISPTHWQASTFPAAWRDRITVCHDGIDTRTIAPDPAAQLTLGSGVVLTQADEVITYVSRHLEPYRGFHWLMRLLPTLLDARPQAHIVIVGDDEIGYGAAPTKAKTWREQMVQEIAPAMDPAHWARVHFVGRLPREDFTRVLQVSRLHLYWSYPFVLSWSLIEAMSAGACILASDTAPIREVIKDGEHGRLADFFDPSAWLRHALDLLDDPVRRRALAQGARHRAVQQYDLHSVCLPRQQAWVSGLLGTLPGLTGDL